MVRSPGHRCRKPKRGLSVPVQRRQAHTDAATEEPWGDARRDNPAPFPGLFLVETPRLFAINCKKTRGDRFPLGSAVRIGPSACRIIGMVSLRPLATIDGEAGSERAI